MKRLPDCFFPLLPLIIVNPDTHSENHENIALFLIGREYSQINELFWVAFFFFREKSNNPQKIK